MQLDLSEHELQQAFAQVGDILTALYDQAQDRRVFPGFGPSEVLDRFDEPLPQEGTDLGRLLNKVRTDVVDTATLNIGPRYYGYITGGGNHVAVLAEAIRAALNQNNLKWHSSPVSSEMEQLVIRWLAEFIGYSTECAGALLGGGSVANFECMAVARAIKAPVNIAEEGMYNCPPLTIYVSDEGHSSFDKAVDMLGIGKRYLRKIPVDGQFRICPDLLEQQIEDDKRDGLHPICAIGVAGTTNSGAVDDLRAVSQVCNKHNLWFHVDAAYGGPAAQLNSVGHLFEGIEQADSVVVNPHKWLYVPFEAGATLFKNPNQVRRTFSHIPDYLRAEGDGRVDQMEYNLPLTKDFKALKVWMTIKAFGANRLRQAIQGDIDKASYLCQLVEDAADLEVLAPAPLSIVCFRVVRNELDESALNRLNDSIIKEVESDGRIFLTGTKINDKTALRVCFINHRSGEEDVDYLLEVVRDIASQW